MTAFVVPFRAKSGTTRIREMFGGHKGAEGAEGGQSKIYSIQNDDLGTKNKRIGRSLPLSHTNTAEDPRSGCM